MKTIHSQVMSMLMHLKASHFWASSWPPASPQLMWDEGIFLPSELSYTHYMLVKWAGWKSSPIRNGASMRNDALFPNTGCTSTMPTGLSSYKCLAFVEWFRLYGGYWSQNLQSEGRTITKPSCSSRFWIKQGLSVGSWLSYYNHAGFFPLSFWPFLTQLIKRYSKTIFSFITSCKVHYCFC